MFNIFKRSSPAVLGIDISKSGVKLIELREHGASYRVAAFAVEPLPEGAFVEQTITDEDAVAEAISRALAKSKSKVSQAAVALSGSAVITKLIDIDSSLSDSEMESQITVEADNFIPFDINDVMVDFEVQKKPASGQAEVLVAVCRSETTDTYDTVLSIADLTAKIIDVELYVLERAVSLLTHMIDKNYKDKIIALVDIGAASTHIYVYHKNDIIYNREQAFGGDQLTEVIKHQCNIETKEAIEIQKGHSTKKMVEPIFFEDFCEQCAQQVSQALQFFYSTSGHSTVDQIIVCGGAAATKGLKDHMEKQLKVKCEIANPFEKMSIARKINKKLLYENAPGMMIACGLAMRSFD